MSTFAVIETGGKQYKVALGDKIKVEKLEAEADSIITFKEVLLSVDGSKATIGAPYVDGPGVEAKVLRQARDRKKTVFRYHSKVRYRKMKGHRQHFTELEITKI
jgi:large subunit ribosomal protein L21